MAEILKPSFISNTWARTGVKVEPSNSKKDIGWVPEIPTAEMFNWIDNRQDEFNAHVNQRGIPEWDTSTEYIADKSYVQTASGEIFRSVSDSINQSPTSDTSATYWKIWNSNNETQPTLTSGYTHSLSIPLTYRVDGGKLTLNGQFSLSGAAPANVVTLPPTHRPKFSRYMNAVKVSASSITSPCTLLISTTGVITIINTTQSSGDSFYISGEISLW